MRRDVRPFVFGLLMFVVAYIFLMATKDNSNTQHNEPVCLPAPVALVEKATGKRSEAYVSVTKIEFDGWYPRYTRGERWTYYILHVLDETASKPTKWLVGGPDPLNEPLLIAPEDERYSNEYLDKRNRSAFINGGNCNG